MNLLNLLLHSDTMKCASCARGLSLSLFANNDQHCNTFQSVTALKKNHKCNSSKKEAHSNVIYFIGYLSVII